MRTIADIRKLTCADIPVVDLLALVALIAREAQTIPDHDAEHDWKSRRDTYEAVERAFEILDAEPDHGNNGLAGPHDQALSVDTLVDVAHHSREAARQAKDASRLARTAAEYAKAAAAGKRLSV